MNVAQLREFLKDQPDDMPVVAPTGEECFMQNIRPRVMEAVAGTVLWKRYNPRFDRAQVNTTPTNVLVL